MSGVNMTKRTDTVEKAVAEAAAIAADAGHGYDQASRWGPDYDCSSLVIHCWQSAGVVLECTYTGDMRGDMLRRGFADVTDKVRLADGAGLMRGDVLLNFARHTALYIGGGRLIHASANERGAARGGAPGDQTGREICERGYFNYPWECVLRYMPAEVGAAAPPSAEEGEAVVLPTLGVGSTGAAVAAMQGALLWRGFDPRWVDGEFGERTRRAVLALQREHGLTECGVCARREWRALLGQGVDA